MADHIHRLRLMIDKMELSPSVGLLYPGPHARLLNELAPEDRPQQLVLLDGTWHHTKTLFRDIPRLQSLPQFSLAPTEPSRYTIRREPQFHCLSTLEATVAALQCLEPETQGLADVLAPFHTMIADQLAHPKSQYGHRRNLRRGDPRHQVPRLLRDQPQHLVAVYGETLPTFTRNTEASGVMVNLPCPTPTPIVWTAERLSTGERLRCLIQPSIELSSSFLQHLEVPPTAFDQALTWSEAQSQWLSFLRPHDSILYYYANQPKLLNQWGCSTLPRLSLKGIPLLQLRCKHRLPHGDSLQGLLQDLGIAEPPLPGEIRADRRLRATVRLAHYLQTL